MKKEASQIARIIWAVVAFILLVGCYFIIKNKDSQIGQYTESVEEIQKRIQEREKAFSEQMKVKQKEIEEIQKRVPSIEKLNNEKNRLYNECQKIKKQPKEQNLKPIQSQFNWLLNGYKSALEDSLNGNVGRQKIIEIQADMIDASKLFYEEQKIDFLRSIAILKINLKKERKEKYIWSAVAFVAGGALMAAIVK